MRLIAIAFCLSLATLGKAATWYVATNGADTSHDRWEAAYTNLQTALDASSDTDTLLVAGHVFQLTNQLLWTARAGVSIRGGYTATNTLGVPGERDPARWPSILTRDPASINRILVIDSVTNGLLDGVTICGGLAYLDGGGLLVTNSSNLWIVDCSITNNQAMTNAAGTIYGGGIHVTSNSSVTVSNSLIKGNGTVSDRYVESDGGGLSAAGGTTVLVVNSTIARNRAYNPSISANARATGGGVYNAGAMILRNCLVIRNESLHNSNSSDFERGDGVYAAAGSLVMENCTLAHNYGQGVYRAVGTAALTNCILWANGDDVSGTVTLASCATEDGDNAGVDGNRGGPVLFEYGYYLATNSPCVNAGTNGTGFTGGGYTTRADGAADSNAVDMGYHPANGFNLSWADLYVATDGTNTNSGLSAEQPKRSISAALALARDGSRIHVAAGEYGTNFLETFPLTINDLAGVQLIGAGMTDTIVNAGGVDTVIRTAHAPAGRIEGLTLTGSANTGGNGGGAGILYCLEDFTVAGCIITNNMVGGGRYGAGLAFDGNCKAVVSNCLIRHNLAPGDNSCGGGIAVGSRTALEVIESAIASNKAVSWHNTAAGGGIYNGGGLLVMRNCIVACNRCQYGGGNDGYEHGHGIYANGATFLDYCTVAGNTNKGLHYAGGILSVSNSIVWNNGDDIVAGVGQVYLFNSNIGNGDSNGVGGCVSIEPWFADTAFFHLASKGGHYAGGFFFGGYWTNSSATNSPFIDALDGEWAREPQPNGRRRNWEGYANTPVASKTFLEEPGVFTSLTVHAYDVIGLGTNCAILNGEILHGGIAGTNAGLVFCWGLSDQGTTGTGIWEHADHEGSRAQWELVGHDISNLTSGADYFYRCWVTNTAGEQDWSDCRQFTAIALPVVTNPGAGYVWNRRAELRGTVLDAQGESPEIWFYYWDDGGSSTSVVALGTQNAGFSNIVIDLAPDTTYSYAFLSSNQAGIVWSDVQSFTTLAGAMNWYVATNGTATWATNWSTAFATLQQAIDVARSNDTVNVAGHRFTLNNTLIWGPSSRWVTIRGGYAATNDADAPGKSDPILWPAYIVQTCSVYSLGVLQVIGVTNGTLENVTITGGNNGGHGGGIAILSSADILLGGCTIVSNQTTGGNRYGGGLYVDGSSQVTVSNCAITHNFAGTDYDIGGGGIMLNSGGRMLVVNSVIATNRANTWHSGLYGGGIRNAGALTLRNCLLYGNWIIYGSGNEGYEHGDAIYTGGNLALENCTVVGNGNEGIERGGGSAALTNCIVWGNGSDTTGSMSAVFCDIGNPGGLTALASCTNADPLFAGATTNNYRLAKQSPCRDAGTNCAGMAGTLDLDGNPRIRGGRIDMGAYELPGLPLGIAFSIR